MAAPAKNAVSTGKPKVAGSVYIGSAAAAAPPTPTTELGTGLDASRLRRRGRRDE